MRFCVNRGALSGGEGLRGGWGGGRLNGSKTL